MSVKRQAVLIIDDTAANIEILSYILQDETEILSVSNGPDGLTLAATKEPDLILLDILMPDMDGYEVCKRLKEDPKTHAIPVIFITAMSQEIYEAKGLEVGAIDYITKPFSPLIVRARVRNHLELKRYRDNLENLSLTDGLTGIPNRRQFDEVFDREWRRAIRNQSPLSLIILDIDFFKAFNDHHGHLAGDDCLRRLAKALAESIHRPADLLARYGGEEFAGVLPETDADGALRVARQIQEKINGLNIPHAHSAVADHVTVSLGLATVIPSVGQSPSELIQRADSMLYKAKQNGRNQIQN